MTINEKLEISFKKPEVQNINDVKKYLDKARGKNRNIQQTLSNESITGIVKDTDHLKLFVYILTAALFFLAAAGWQLYLHIDDKIDHKLDYLNSRIDNALNKNIEN